MSTVDEERRKVRHDRFVVREDVGEPFGERYVLDAEPYGMEFKVYIQLTDFRHDGPVYEVIRENLNGIPFHEYTSDVNVADIFAEGHVKWDGCMDIQWSNSQSHHCGLDHAQIYSRVVNQIYAFAAELIEQFDRKCAGMDTVKS